MSCGQTSATNQGSSEAFSELVVNKTFTQEAYSILKCDHCGLYYKDHILDQQTFNEYYNSFDFKAWAPTGNYPTEDIVEKYLSERSNLKVFDYGCSEGRFLSKFINKHECYGYDIDQRAMAIAGKKGISILSATDISTIKNKFDAVILSDVFEHSIEPTKLIDSLLKMLNEKGVLIITTGYADAPACRYDIAHCWYFRSLQHVCMLGDDYIKHLQESFKIRTLDKIITSHYKVSFQKKIFYGLRFEAYKFVNDNRNSFMVKLLSVIPGLKKITKWKDLPYYPFSKDHVVLFLQQ